MGIPVWNESKHEESRAKADPTAHDRSAIRRQRLYRNTTTYIDEAALTQRLDSDQDARDIGGVRRWNTRHPSTRPRSRRGPTTSANRAAFPPEPVEPTVNYSPTYTLAAMLPPEEMESREVIELPPLRRMSGRNIANEMPRTTIRRRAPTPPVLDGMGDRRRSPSHSHDSPSSPSSEADPWRIMGDTITPDTSLPSAGNSFESAATNEEAVETTQMRRSTDVSNFLSGAPVYNPDCDDCDDELPSPSPSDSDAADLLLAELRDFERTLHDFIHRQGNYEFLSVSQGRAVISTLRAFLQRVGHRHETNDVD